MKSKKDDYTNTDVGSNVSNERLWKEKKKRWYTNTDVGSNVSNERLWKEK